MYIINIYIHDEYIYIYIYDIYIYIHMIYIYMFRHSQGEPKLLAISGIVHHSVRNFSHHAAVFLGLRYRDPDHIFLENRW